MLQQKQVCQSLDPKLKLFILSSVTLSITNINETKRRMGEGSTLPQHTSKLHPVRGRLEYCCEQTRVLGAKSDSMEQSM